MIKERVLTGIISLAILGLMLFFASSLFIQIFIALLFLYAAWEFSKFFNFPVVRRRYFFVFLFGCFQIFFYLILPNDLVYQLLLYLALIWWIIVILRIFFFPTNISNYMVWISGFLILLPSYIAIDYLYQLDVQKIIMFFLLIWIADIGAFFSGKFFGKLKLLPKISPGKTWEGVLGEFFVVLVSTSLYGYLGEIDLLILIPFCFAITVLSIVGDLTISVFKRNVGLKNSGSIFPGHGGLLDRIDSMTSTSPFFAAGIVLFNL